MNVDTATSARRAGRRPSVWPAFRHG